MSHERQRGDWWKEGEEEPPEYDPEITGGDDPMHIDPYDREQGDPDLWWKVGDPPPIGGQDEDEYDDGLEPA